MEPAPGLFEYKHGAQSYFGITLPQSRSLRSCVIVEDTPRPYLNWLLEAAAHFDMRLAVVLPFSDGAIELLSGGSITLGSGKDARHVQIPDPAQCVAILDMHNDPERRQLFDGYDPSLPMLAGLHLWHRIPPSSRVNFLIASRWEETVFADQGLTLAFTQLDKAVDPQRPELPSDARQNLTKKLSSFYAKADRHASCEILRTGPDKYALRFRNSTIHPRGKPVTRLYLLLKYGKLSCNELCRLSGSPSREDSAHVERGLPDGDGRFSFPDQLASSSGLSGEELRSKKKMYDDTCEQHRKLSAELESKRTEGGQRDQKVDQQVASLKGRLARILVEAQNHFQREYGCAFIYGGEDADDALERQLQSNGDSPSSENAVSSLDREAFDRDHDLYRSRMHPLLQDLLSLEEATKKEESHLARLAESLKAMGQQRDDLWREIHGKHKDTTKGPKPQETIRKDFFESGSTGKKRGLFYLLQQAGGSQDLLDFFRRSIVPTPGGVAYVGELTWKIS